MKSLQNMANAEGLNKALEQPSTAKSQVVTEHTINFVNKVMKTILANSPAWSMSLKGSDSIDDYRLQLVKAFMENNITQMSQVDLGLKRIRKEPTNFLPSVGQFINWCTPTPEAIGCPSIDDAYREACHYRYSRKPLSHPCVAYALAKVSPYELANKTERETKGQFERFYQQAVERYYQGDNLAEYVERFTRKVDPSLAKLTDMKDDPAYWQRSQANAKKHIEEIKAKLKKGH